MLNSLNDQDRIQPQQARHEWEERPIESFECPRTQLLPQPLLYTRQVDRSVVLRHQKDDGDCKPNEEAPLEQRVHVVEHAVGPKNTPHKTVAVHWRAVIGTRELLRLVRRTEALDVIHDEILRTDRHEAGDDDGSNLGPKYSPGSNLAIVCHLLILYIIV